MNNQIFFFFNNFAHQSGLGDKLIVFFAVYFPYLVVALAGIVLFFYRKSWWGFGREFFLVFASSGVAYIFSKILKILIHTNRPFVEFSNVQVLDLATGFAFPSGHATFFMALAVAIFLVHKKAGYIFILFAFFIGLARIVAGVHFPVDILGGFILGGIISYLVAYWSKNVYNADIL